MLFSTSQKLKLPPRMPTILSVPSLRSKIISPLSAKKTKLVLKEPYGASATVDLTTAQVTSWKNDRGDELLFSSSKGSSKSVRGGIHFGFPQFRTVGAFENQMYTRTGVWTIDPNPAPLPTCGNKVFIDLILRPATNGDFKVWLHCFEFRLRIALGAGMITFTSRIRNMDAKAFSFTFALHTYLAVSDISEVRVEGLETSDYLDNLNMRQRYTEQGDAITFDSEVDRVYLSTPSKIAIIDHEKKQTFVLRKDSGLPDAVVWNPWEKRINDLGDEDYKQMICVQAAAIEKPIILRPGEEWRGRQELSTVPSSYFSGQLDPAKVLSM